VFARSLVVSPTVLARVIRTVNAGSGGLRPGQPRNAIVGDPAYLEKILELAAEETGAGPVNDGSGPEGSFHGRDFVPLHSRP
jgi:hypothetical protein